MAPTLTLPTPARRAFERLAGDLTKIFGTRFEALVATSRAASLAFVATLAADDLDALAALADTWRKDALAVPLVMTPEEFRRSLTTFPLEYQAMLDHHVVIAGTAPFDGVAIDRVLLAQACEVRARGHLLHLRQGWIEAAGHHDRLATLIAHSATPLRALLRNVARLSGSEAGTAEDGARLAGIPDPIIGEVLALEHAPDGAEALVARLPEYLAAAERLWAFVDRRP